MKQESSNPSGDNVKMFFTSLLKEAWLASWELIKITVPIVICTRILEQFGFISICSAFLQPLMEVIGLPGSLGIVWTTAMLTSLYGGIAVFAALAPGLELTGAQVTVLCSAMLIAHSLPIELTVSKKAGAQLLPIAFIRLTGAVLYAFFLHRFCLAMGLWQEPAAMFLFVSNGPTDLLSWSLQQLRNIAMIIIVVFCIVLCMRVFKSIGLLGLMERSLAPVLPFFGMSKRAAPITVVGMIMGIGYGGALIIRETSTGELSREEVFNSMALMGLCHGLVEDTLLMAAIGGKFGGILWGRILFSLAVVFLLVKSLRRLAERKKSCPIP